MLLELLIILICHHTLQHFSLQPKEINKPLNVHIVIGCCNHWNAALDNKTEGVSVLLPASHPPIHSFLMTAFWTLCCATMFPVSHYIVGTCHSSLPFNSICLLFPLFYAEGKNAPDDLSDLERTRSMLPAWLCREEYYITRESKQ